MTKTSKVSLIVIVSLIACLSPQFFNGNAMADSSVTSDPQLSGYEPLNIEEQRSHKYQFNDGDSLAVEVISLKQNDATVFMTAKFKNLTNNDFYLGCGNEKIFLLDDDGEQWQCTDNDYGFNYLRPNYQFSPDVWHKITFQFNKPKGRTDSSSFTFLQEVQILGTFHKIKISIKNIPSGYSS